MLDAHPKSAIFCPASRALQEGRIAIVTDVGREMRWTLWRRKTNVAFGGRRSRVVLTPRRWRQVSREAIPAKRQWQNSPVTGESRNKP